MRRVPPTHHPRGERARDRVRSRWRAWHGSLLHSPAMLRRVGVGADEDAWGAGRDHQGMTSAVSQKFDPRIADGCHTLGSMKNSQSWQKRVQLTRGERGALRELLRAGRTGLWVGMRARAVLLAG